MHPATVRVPQGIFDFAPSDMQIFLRDCYDASYCHYRENVEASPPTKSTTELLRRLTSRCVSRRHRRRRRVAALLWVGFWSEVRGVVGASKIESKMPTMLERLKSLRKSIRVKAKPSPNSHPVFSFDHLPTNVKLGILSRLSVRDLANFAATSRTSDAFVRDHREELPKYNVDSVAVCFDPQWHLVCLRVVDEKRYFQSVVLPANVAFRYLECISVRSSVRFQLGVFHYNFKDRPVARYDCHSAVSLFMTDFTMPQIKRTRRFIADIRKYLPKLLGRLYSHCEVFRLDSLILVFQERYFLERAKSERISPMRRISGIFAKSNFCDKANHCRMARRKIVRDHNCRQCTDTSFLSTDFPLF